VFAGLSLSAAAIGGCGSTNDGPPRYRLSGSVTYNGSPVVAGFVTFAPDPAKKNSGPGGGASIRNGRYQTDADKGIVGGPHIVRIIGYDGIKTVLEGEELTDGKPLFEPYEASIDFPKQNSTHDFVVPAGPAGAREPSPN
jgi:hypothetical protein